MKMAEVRTGVAAQAETMVDLRRRIHRFPEVGLRLPLTQSTVLEALEGLPLEIGTGTTSSSVTAVLRGGQANGKSILLRADMDALPVQELTGLPYESAIDGVMHACGHDLHTAMLVGAVKVLCEHRDTLAGDVIFMFQPGEEGHDGARIMIEDGVLEAAGAFPAGAYGIHVMADKLAAGTFTTKPGVMMAANDSATIVFRGQGGHGSAPHLANDPVPAVTAMTSAIQVLVTRKFDVFDPVVVTVGAIRAGNQNNIIPETARIDITLRTFSAEARRALRREILRAAQGTAMTYGVEVEVEYQDGYPATINDEQHAIWVEQMIAASFGADRFVRMDRPISATEDFSRIIEKVSGAYVFLAAGVPGGEFNHSPRVLFDEAVMIEGAALHVALAARRLEHTSGNEGIR